MSHNQRPLDELKNSIGKNIIVRLRGSHIMRGVLKSYDPHLNLHLENAVFVKHEENAQEEQVGQIILRGDNVLMISPH